MFCAKAVVNSAMPAITGTLPSAASLATSITANFSCIVIEVFSPTVPHTTRPETPSRTRFLITVWVASRSREKSLRNWVVTAGNTPLQLMALWLIVFVLSSESVNEK